MLESYSILRSDSVISDNTSHDAPQEQQEPKEENPNPNPNPNPNRHPHPQPNVNPAEISSQSLRKTWPPGEVARLLSLRADFPDMPWEELQEVHFPDRTINALKGKIWRVTESGAAKTRKRSRSESSGGQENGSLGDIPYEGPNLLNEFKERLGQNSRPIWEPAGSARNTTPRNPKPPQSTSKRPSSGPQARKPVRHSLPITSGFNAVNKPQVKKTRKSSVQLSDNEAPILSSANDSKEDNRVQLALQLLDPKLWNQIYDEARQCEPERRRANNALREKAALEAELKDVKSRLRKLEKTAYQPRPGPSMHHSPVREMDEHGSRKLKAAWRTVINTCKDSISFTNWESAGMSEAVKVVQSEIDKMTKYVPNESPVFSDGTGISTDSEHDDHGDNVMGNLNLFEK